MGRALSWGAASGDAFGPRTGGTLEMCSEQVGAFNLGGRPLMMLTFVNRRRFTYGGVAITWGL